MPVTAVLQDCSISNSKLIVYNACSALQKLLAQERYETEEAAAEAAGCFWHELRDLSVPSTPELQLAGGQGRRMAGQGPAR